MTLEQLHCVVRNNTMKLFKKRSSHSRLTVRNIHDIRKRTNEAQQYGEISCALTSNIWSSTTVVEYYALPRVYCPYALERHGIEYLQKINTTTYFCLWNDALVWNHDEHTFTMESCQIMIDDENDWVATVEPHYLSCYENAKGGQGTNKNTSDTDTEGQKKTCFCVCLVLLLRLHT